MNKSGYPGHDSMREKAERAFGSAELRGYDKPSRPSDCYKSGGKVHHGRVKKDIGGEIQKAGIMGLPSYLIDGVGDAINGLKSGGKANHKTVRKNMGGIMGMPDGGLFGPGLSWTKRPSSQTTRQETPPSGLKGGGNVKKPVRRNIGGMMGSPVNTADSIQQANQLLSNAAANGTGLKRGGHARHKHSMRHKRADGGAMNTMGDRDFSMGKKAMGFADGGKMRAGGHNKDRARKSLGGLLNGISNVLSDRPWSASPQSRFPAQQNAATAHVAPATSTMAAPAGSTVMKRGGKMCHREMGGEVKKAIGGVGKIRHGQMTKKGAQIAPRARFKG